MSMEVSEHTETSLPTTSSEISSTEPPVTMASTLLFADNSVTAFKETGNESAGGTELSKILLFTFPIFILIIIIPLIIFIVKQKRWKKATKGETKDEETKSPIFEEDTPSVMEIEMEELDKWMNSKRLSTLEEENKLHASLCEDEF
ncbi:transmembrane protein 154-like isoform X2 [Xenopus laevis]|uniref:Transmembrane protein 154-like isoform X2 n=1 Tax=Xenopus laevis TaxID=8355 RepID=A0A8J1M2C8_XENLA|nr:transmembrane protein 154-like isoform X2 [Xenopus laevis]